MKQFHHVAASLFAILAVLLMVTATSAQGAELQVINHVFSTRVVANPDGSLDPHDTIVGFQKGAASFHTLTHVVFHEGTHEVTVRLLDPEDRVIVSRRLPNVVAKEAQWVEAIWVEWAGIPLTQTGRHHFSITVDGVQSATFPFMVY